MDDKEVERRLKELSKENNKNSPDKKPKKHKRGRNTAIGVVIAAAVAVVIAGGLYFSGNIRPASYTEDETLIAEAADDHETAEAEIAGAEADIAADEVYPEPDEGEQGSDVTEGTDEDTADTEDSGTVTDDAAFGEELEAEKIADAVPDEDSNEDSVNPEDASEEAAASEAVVEDSVTSEDNPEETASADQNESEERELSGWAAAAVASKEFKEIAASGDFGYVSLDAVPAFSGDPYVIVNGNNTFFTDSDYTTEVFETYSDLDGLGRCGPAYANLCKELMPTGRREYIRNIYPSGYHNTKYSFIDGEYVYNRCHLIAFSLAGESANEKNLITGTQYMNIEGMYPFEYMVGDYIRRKNNHVLYRVTPIYEGDNLVASGVLIEGSSVEDKGEGLNFCVYCYNVQPGVQINYATGRTQSDGTMD